MESKAMLKKIKAVKPMQWLVLFVFLCVLASMMLKDVGLAHPRKKRSASPPFYRPLGGGKADVVALLPPIKSDTQSVFSSGTVASTPIGAVIVSEGAGNITVRLSLVRAVRTLLGLSEDAVEVFIMDMQKKELLP